MPIENNKVIPVEGKIYHAATVCCPDAVAVGDFGWLAGKSIAWTMVPNAWLKEFETPPADPGVYFPTAAVNDVWFRSSETCVPFVRISPRSKRKLLKVAEPLFSVAEIAKGTFDAELTQWAMAAKDFPGPLLVEFGVEMNGDWEPWNATYNGKDSLPVPGETAPDGKPRLLGQKNYRDAHIHLIEICRQANVDNITWVFHVNANDNPSEPWNRMAGYYPGDEYIDWIGASCYAAHTLEPLVRLNEILDPFIELARGFSPGVANGTKPLAICELGAIDYPAGQGQLPKPIWIRDAYQMLAEGSNVHGRYRDQIKAVSWWDESWWDDNDTNVPPFLANNQVASSPSSVDAYRAALSHDTFIPL